MNKFVNVLCVGLSLVTIVSAFAGCSINKYVKTIDADNTGSVVEQEKENSKMYLRVGDYTTNTVNDIFDMNLRDFEEKTGIELNIDYLPATIERTENCEGYYNGEKISINFSPISETSSAIRDCKVTEIAEFSSNGEESVIDFSGVAVNKKYSKNKLSKTLAKYDHTHNVNDNDEGLGIYVADNGNNEDLTHIYVTLDDGVVSFINIR